MMDTKQSTTNSVVNVGIKRFDAELPLPVYQTTGSVAVDLCARLDVTIGAQTVGYVPLNVGLELPRGYYAQLSARSSLHKRGLLLANGIGIGDYDFRGDSDEYQAALFNFSQQTVEISRGERLVQLMVLPAPKIVWEEKTQLASQDRGGFGSTGRS